MKIAQLNNQSSQNYQPKFGAKIDAPAEFWEEATHSSLPKWTLNQVKDALRTIKNDGSDRVIRLSKSQGRNTWSGGAADVYTATEVTSGLNVAEKKDCGWAKFIVKTADRFVNEFNELSNLVKDVKAN